MNPHAPEAVSPPPRRRRFWFPLGVVGFAALALATLPFASDLDRNIRLVAGEAVLILAAVLCLIWAMWFGQFSRRTRVLTLVVPAVVGLTLKLALRVDGTADGRGLPRLVWRWSAQAPRVFSPPSLPATPTAATVTSTLADVPQFFGPRRDGIVNGAGLARDWAKSAPRELWRQPIGAGWSAFAVVGGRAFTQEQRGEEELVSCYEVLTGRLVWSHARRAKFSQWQAGDGPHATPTVGHGRVFAYGATGILSCLDAATGAPIWTHEVLAENKLENLEWGISASPLLTGDLVVVTGGGTPVYTLLAYDRATGALKWRSGTDRASYSSPIATTFAGRPVIVSFNAATFTLHDPVNGTVRLSETWGMQIAPKGAQPVTIDGDRLFLTAGYGMGCELFQIHAGTDGSFSAESKWKNLRLKAQFNSVAARDGFLYGLDDGLLACVEIATGTRRWKDGRYGSGQTLLVDDLILVQAERGDVVLVEANPEAFRELGRIAALTSKTWSHPTLAGRHLLVRNDREAVCYELPAATAAP